jgi:hypothetical protein
MSAVIVIVADGDGHHFVRHVDYHDGFGIAEIEGDNQSGIDEFRTDLGVVERAFEDAADVLADLFRVVEPHRSLPHHALFQKTYS